MEKPYLYEEYNLSCWVKPPLNHIRSVPVRIINAVIEGLNAHVPTDMRLPRYIIIMPDQDLIIGSAEHQDYSILTILEGQLSWLIKQFKKYLTRRREDLRDKRPGALDSTFTPKLVWVKMIDLSAPARNNYQLRKVQALRKRFNALLDDLLIAEHFMYIIYVHKFDADDRNVHFLPSGELSQISQMAFWTYINRQIQQLDLNEDDFLPKGQTADRSKHHHRHEMNHSHHSDLPRNDSEVRHR